MGTKGFGWTILIIGIFLCIAGYVEGGFPEFIVFVICLIGILILSEKMYLEAPSQVEKRPLNFNGTIYFKNPCEFHDKCAKLKAKEIADSYANKRHESVPNWMDFSNGFRNCNYEPCCYYDKKTKKEHWCFGTSILREVNGSVHFCGYRYLFDIDSNGNIIDVNVPNFIDPRCINYYNEDLEHTTVWDNRLTRDDVVKRFKIENVRFTGIQQKEGNK